MAEQQTLADLKDVIAGTPAGEGAAASVEAAPLPEPKIDELGRSYATGKRKNSIARVWIKPGNGKITINGRDQEVYFARPVLRLIIAQAFQVADRVDGYDVIATVKGGGLSGQAGANTVRRKPVRASSSRSVRFTQTNLVYVSGALGNQGAFFIIGHGARK